MNIGEWFDDASARLNNLQYECNAQGDTATGLLIQTAVVALVAAVNGLADDGYELDEREMPGSKIYEHC